MKGTIQVSMISSDESLLFFDHPYPRYGLAVAIVQRGKKYWREVLDDGEGLLEMVADVIEHGLNHFRLYTPNDVKNDTELRYKYLTDKELETSGQDADSGYLVAPHVVTEDAEAWRLIKFTRSVLADLRSGADPKKPTKLKRSAAPFSAKLNQGKGSLSYLKVSKLEAACALAATLTPLKPAAQVDFTNQVMIPDLDLEGMIRFVQLFRDMQGSELENPLTRQRKEGSKRKRPPIFDGNYPDAPRSSAFGPVGLMGAMGQWAKRANRLPEVAPVLEQMTGRPIYLVSYNGSLMRQEYVGHHAARLAQEHNLPAIIDSLYWARFYNDEDNKPDSPTKKNFFRMASRFLQLYTRPAFRDFLAFRVQYDAIFSPIITDFIMSEYQIDRDIVRSARAYGAYLNTVAFFIAKEEVEQNEEQEGGGTGRNLYEAKARALAQLESTALSARRPSALFAQLNVMAGRQANRDVPAEAARFIEAVNTGEVEFDEARDLVLAYMRLHSDKASTEESEVSADEIDDTGYMTEGS